MNMAIVTIHPLKRWFRSDKVRITAELEVAVAEHFRATGDPDLVALSVIGALLAGVVDSPRTGAYERELLMPVLEAFEYAMSPDRKNEDAFREAVKGRARAPITGTEFFRSMGLG